MKPLFVLPKKILLAGILINLSCVIALWAQTPAFPGAEGYGRFAKGGRGGDVYIVTSIKDHGKGSLRYGIEKAKGPRTIVFEISGTIELKSHLEVRIPYLTIAGQTAPGDGICLKDYGLKIMDCNDVIVRYIRIRLGDENKKIPAGYDAIETNGVSNIIFDHISASWGIDGIHDLRGEKFTLQWSIYGEALHNSLHEKGPHAMLGSMRDLTDNITLHHNLFHSSRHRHPTLGGGSRTDKSSIVDFRNNVLFNWSGPTNLGGCRMNLINNYYKPGKDTNPEEKPMAVKAHIGENSTGFTSGNIFTWNDEWTRDNFSAIDYVLGWGSYDSTTREAFTIPAELVNGDNKPKTQTATEAFELVLKKAGASLSRDDADHRVVAGVFEGTGRLIDSQSEVGGWPELRSYPAPTDKDRDGMSDAWEEENGLNPADPYDRNGDGDSDGYTNLEEYLHHLTQ